MSRARPSPSGSPPASRTSAASVWLFELATFRPLRISSGWSTSTISSPPPRMPTRGRRNTSGCATASEASTPSSAAPSSVPASSTVAPRRMSSPTCRRLIPASRSLRISTTSTPRSVSSCRMTPSAPAGSGAPVKMRAHSPRWRVWVGKLPAGMLLDDAEPHRPLRGRAAHIVGARGVSVHRRIGPGGKIEGAHQRLGEHRAERVVEGNAERWLPRDRGQDAEGGLPRGEGAHGPTTRAPSHPRLASKLQPHRVAEAEYTALGLEVSSSVTMASHWSAVAEAAL